MSVPRQPRHRRPSFMRDGNTYRMHLQSNVSRHKKGEAIDSSLDGYSYNPDHYPAWRMPQELRDTLPKSLAGVIDDWSYAGAAVQTSLGRIALLDHDGMERGWPEKPVNQVSSTSSDATSMVFPSPPSSATSPPNGPFPMYDEAVTNALPAAYSTQHKLDDASAMMNSPPCSAEDTKLPEALYVRPPAPINTSFDLDTTPASSFESTTSSASSSPFDATAWERYLDEYQREVDGVQREDLPRFRHLAHRAEVEYRLLQGEIAPEIQLNFSCWWKGMAAKMESLSAEVERISMPTLQEIQHVRRVYGLHV